jgi:hypothetical protein
MREMSLDVVRCLRVRHNLILSARRPYCSVWLDAPDNPTPMLYRLSFR